MLLTQLAEAIVTSLSESPPETWGELKIPSDIPVHFALDPFTDSGESIKGPSVFVIPSYVQYTVDKRRNANQPPKKIKYITIALCIRIHSSNPDTPVYDVTTLDKAKQYIDLKEELDDFLLGMDIGANLVEYETEPPDELELKDNFYVVTSVLGYATC